PERRVDRDGLASRRLLLPRLACGAARRDGRGAGGSERLAGLLVLILVELFAFGEILVLGVGASVALRAGRPRLLVLALFRTGLGGFVALDLGLGELLLRGLDEWLGGRLDLRLLVLTVDLVDRECGRFRLGACRVVLGRRVGRRVRIRDRERLGRV